MTDMRLLKADHERPKLRLAQPLRHGAAQHPPPGFGAHFALAGDDQHKGEAVMMRAMQKAGERTMRAALRHPMQVEPCFDLLSPARKLRALATPKWRQRRRHRLLRSRVARGWKRFGQNSRFDGGGQLHVL